MATVYNTSEDLVKVLKSTLRPYKSLIKSQIERQQRFPFLSLEKIPKLDDCVRDLQLNDNQYNESIDRKLNKISRKYCRKHKNLTEEEDTVEELPPKKKKMIVNSNLDLNLIKDLNEDLDFEEVDEDQIRSKPTPSVANGAKITNGINFHKKNGFVHKTDYQKTNGSIGTTYNSNINGETTGLSNGVSMFNNLNNNNFKIPKKNSQSIESIISLAKQLSQRPVEAFDHLNRFLTEEQWLRKDVLEQLLSIAKSMVSNKDFGTNVSKFNQLMDKIKELEYIDDDFWDEIIYSVEKKRNDCKNIQEIISFLMSLHDFMIENKISARLICTEAVITAYRVQTGHPSAKDLIELQQIENQMKV